MILFSLISLRRPTLIGVVLLLVAFTSLQTSQHLKALAEDLFPDLHPNRARQHETAEQADPSPGVPSPTLPVEGSGWWQKSFGVKGKPAEHVHAPKLTVSPSVTSRSRAKYSTVSRDNATQIRSKIQSVLDDWIPPTGVRQWPPYEWYGDLDYDPNAWEGFEWNNDYYINNGVQMLAARPPSAVATSTPTPYLPYPKFNSPAWKAQWKGHYVPCTGPRGKPIDESLRDMMHAWPRVPDGFPKPAIGDAEVMGIDIDHCFDRFHRFRPYGYGEEKFSDVPLWQQRSTKLDWSETPWGELQDQCVLANKDRYADEPRTSSETTYDYTVPADHLLPPPHISKPDERRSFRSRTAVLIRTWQGYSYEDNDLESIRALIVEVNLLSGGEYQVFLFVNIKQTSVDMYGDHEVYTDTLKANVPRKFWGIAILWSEDFLKKWYPKVGHWDVYWHQFMSVQWFSKTHPEFDFIWNWETDARYTGNHYHFLEKVAKFSRQVPRKYLWERNARFHIPGVYGPYEQFLNDTFATIEQARLFDDLKPVWGPLPYADNMLDPVGPKPPTTMDEDDFEWGVGEEADLITLQPIWDPTRTEWTMRDKIWNFVQDVVPVWTGDRRTDEAWTHPRFPSIPRRAYINTVSRFSRRQLHAMHIENLNGRSMQAEMWPATAALHHGLKAVYAPHPIWTDRKWPAWYMDAVFNADAGQRARWSQGPDSVYAHDREHNFHGWSWYFDSAFPRVLYRRWLGWMAEVGPEVQFPTNPLRRLGGKKFENDGVRVKIDNADAAEKGGRSTTHRLGAQEVLVGGKGRMCLPGMLLHPVKSVYRRSETIEEEEDVDGGEWYHE